MALRLSEILEHDAPHLGVTTRRQLLAFYDALKTALREGKLTPEGGALPTSLNELLTLLPGTQPPLKRDRELTDWAVDNDHHYAAFLDGWRARNAAVPKTSTIRPVAAPIYQAVVRLHTLRTGTTKKAELENAVDVFLDVYALSQHALRLPALDRPLPKELPAGISHDAQRVALGDDAKGGYVGLVRRRETKRE